MEQLFDIGDSAGSLLNEGINVFRTFQRISAPKQFATMFSYECVSLFKWVTDFIQILFSLFDSKPLSDFDFYTLYSLVFPLSILFFITTKLSKLMVCVYAIGYAISFGLGALVGKIGKDGKTYIFSFIPIIAFAIFYCVSGPIQQFLTGCCKSKVENDSIEDVDGAVIRDTEYKFHFSFSFLATSIIFSLLILPITSERSTISIALIFFIPILLTIVFFIEFFNCVCCHNSLNGKFKYEAKMVLFLNNILTLLIVPSTEKLVSIVTLDYYYRKQWCCYFSYAVINVLIPIIMSIILIRANHSSVIDKYRNTESSCLYYLNVVDVIKQIIYAFFSSFNIVWGCFSVEMLWVIILLILRPYYKVSDYCISFFTSALIIIGNSITIYSSYKTFGPMNFAETIICFIMICVPAIVSMYIYFIFDFKADDIQSENEMDDIDESTENDEEFDVVEKMGIIIKPFTSFSFFLFGANLHLYFELVHDNY